MSKAYDPDVMARALGELRRHPVPATEKGLGVAPEGPVAPAALVRRHVGAGGFATPLLVLRDSALRANIATMAAYCASAGVELAPHAKTTMAPQLFARQLEAGAWGLTAATVRQARVYRAFGVRRILLANQLVDPAAIAWVAAERERDAMFELCCYADSLAGVALLDETLRSLGAAGGRGLPVLVELGWPGGRTGARGVEQAVAVARAAAAADTLRVVGAACFEGVVGHGASADVLDGVGRFCADLRRLGETIRPLVRYGLDGLPPATLVLTAGGSAYFDVVVRELTRPTDGNDVTVVLRSGCYVTHDHGAYAETSPFERGTAGSGRLVPALELWARVLSRPEPGVACLDAGRRDVAFDEGMPVPLTVRPRGGGSERPARGLAVTKLNDQHAFVEVGASTTLEPGDLVRLGISHPCTTFDKWRVIPVLDDDDHIVDVAHTFF